MRVRSNSGFSIIEVLMVAALLLIGSSVAIVQLRTSLAAVDADKASNLVISQLRYARQIAVDQRRNVLVEFEQPSTIRVTRQDGGGVTTVMSLASLPSGYMFGLPSGSGDTPEGFGNAAPVSFNMQPRGRFLADGVFVTDADIVVNGTVFTIGSGNRSARAVTVTGASGRLKHYHLQGNTWVQR
jgi:prepilin-type N-terminal cleavage/methylation domain-containing protein